MLRSQEADITGSGRSGSLREDAEGGLYRTGEADELGEGIAPFVTDPDISAGIDREGEGFEECGVRRPSRIG